MEVKGFGEGEVLRLDSGEKVFKLDSYKGNPIVEPKDLGLICYENGRPQSGAVFNPGAEIFYGKILLTPRCQTNYRKKEFFDHKSGIKRYRFEEYISEIWPLISDDGIRFQRFNNSVIKGDGTHHKDFLYGIEDVRIIKLRKKYLLIGAGKLNPPFKGDGDDDRIAIYSTTDFKEIAYHGIVHGIESRNSIPFMENDKVYMLLRYPPSDGIFLDVLDAGLEQLLMPEKHRREWRILHERHAKNRILKTGVYQHEKEKIGAGPPPIKTERGWLLIYHGVGEINLEMAKIYGLKKGIKRAYSVSAAILDLENPRDVLCRTKAPIYIPSKPYELYGNEVYPVDVPAVVFPTGIVVVKDKLLLYCGSGDKYVILLTCDLGNLLDYLWDVLEQEKI
ncbi:MAG: hypothetical protein WBD09_03560 [Halobacteriota archaeon]